MRKFLLSFIVVAFLGTISACKFMILPFMLVEHKTTVPAEFDKLKNSRVLILVWAEPETLFDYPKVRLELASYIGDKIRAEVNGVETVDPLKVEDHLEQTLEMVADPEKIGRLFKADKVVYLELLEMQMRSPETPSLLRGRIRASVAVYDLWANVNEIRRYELQPVTAEYPERHPLFNDPTNAQIVRQETYMKFTEMVARKFYKYEEVHH